MWFSLPAWPFLPWHVSGHVVDPLKEGTREPENSHIPLSEALSLMRFQSALTHLKNKASGPLGSLSLRVRDLVKPEMTFGPQLSFSSQLRKAAKPGRVRSELTAGPAAMINALP